jgi:hypothetical protein
MPSRSIVVADQRELEQAITNHTMQGFLVVNRTAELAVLRKPKQFSVVLALLGLLFCGVGLLVYLIVYSNQSDQVVEIRVRSTDQAELRLSEDRRWWWDGEQWQDTTLSVPPRARRSDDGSRWWDGMNWRPVFPSGRMSPSPPPDVPTANRAPDPTASATTTEATSLDSSARRSPSEDEPGSERQQEERQQEGRSED